MCGNNQKNTFLLQISDHSVGSALGVKICVKILLFPLLCWRHAVGIMHNYPLGIQLELVALKCIECSQSHPP